MNQDANFSSDMAGDGKPSDFHREIDRLVVALASDAATDADRERVCQLISENPAARRRYLRGMALVASLEWGVATGETGLRGSELNLDGPNAAAESSLSPASQTLDHKPVLGFPARLSGAFHRPITWSVLAVGVLFAAYFVAISWNMLGHERSIRGEGEGHTVATITASEAAVWSPDSESQPFNPRPRPGAKWHRPRPGAKWSDPRSEITPGQPLSITSGLVELQLKQGATLLIEGPAKWSIDGENQATLTRGKLVAKVPQQAVGFTLQTPTSKIVDLGTEFGVEVAENGASRVNVIQGRVDATCNQGPSVLLMAGDAVQIEHATAPQRVPADLSAFAALRRPLRLNHDAVLFSDNFNGTAHSLSINPDASRDDPDRFGGLLGRLNYLERRPQEDWSTQLNHPEFPFPGALLVAADGQNLTSVSPDVNFASQRPQGVRFTIECDMKPLVAEENGQPLDSWGAIAFASEKSEAAYWDPNLMALLLRPNGGYAVADSSDGVFQEIKSGQLSNDDHPSKSGWYHVRIRYTVIRFDGTEPSDVEIEIDGRQVAKFTSKRSPRANYLALNAYTASGVASCGFDNLQVRFESLGEERRSKINRIDQGQRSGISQGRVANRKLSET